jgi:hypothetical protein
VDLVVVSDEDRITDIEVEDHLASIEGYTLTEGEDESRHEDEYYDDEVERRLTLAIKDTEVMIDLTGSDFVNTHSSRL